MSLQPGESRQTRKRLLIAAGEMFAERGFRAATVREICKRAGANIAAVNYHFGDKERLYAAVLQYAYACSLQKYPPQPPHGETLSAEERLRAFVHSFLKRLFDEGRPAWYGKLMAREMVEPTGALDALVESSIRPQFEMLLSIVRDLLGGSAVSQTTRRCANSVVGQCLHGYHGRRVQSRLYPDQTYASQDVEQLADHVAEFSIGAIRHMARHPGDKTS